MFLDRSDAGRQLGQRLEPFAGDDVVVVGLPRGGVPVAYEVAQILGAPLDVILVRKLGVPFQSELAMGAIGEDGVRVLNTEIISQTNVSPAEIEAVEARERIELERRQRIYRADRPRTPLAGKVVLIVDDGVATGATARAACQVARAEGARRVVLAVPVASSQWRSRLGDSADELIALLAPTNFHSVGQFYSTFRQMSDSEVIDYLEEAAGMKETPDKNGHTPGDHPPPRDEDVRIRAGNAQLAGHLMVPEDAKGLVIFAHGSGSSRHSPRNQFVASVLNRAGLATLLFDLLTTEEEGDRQNVFDIGLLGERLAEVTATVQSHPDLNKLPIGYFGASTGVAAALYAAAMPKNPAMAIVSRGGRPDLAASQLGAVGAPTLLIVGGEDHAVLRLNQAAQARIGSEVELVVVPGATHLFEERGTLQQAAELALEWFLTRLDPEGPTKEATIVKPGKRHHPEHVDHYPVEIAPVL